VRRLVGIATAGALAAIAPRARGQEAPAADAWPQGGPTRSKEAAHVDVWPRRDNFWLREFYLGGAAGSCTRSDANVGATGVCGDLDLGFESATILGATLRLGGELGLGGTPSVAMGYPGIGVTRESGGFAGVARAFVGFDVTSLFFVRPGGQLRWTVLKGHAAFAPQGTFDMGSRLWTHLELGLRLAVGCEAALRADADKHFVYLPFASGLGGFARVFW
jgi:hypothetical protein